MGSHVPTTYLLYLSTYNTTTCHHSRLLSRLPIDLPPPVPELSFLSVPAEHVERPSSSDVIPMSEDFAGPIAFLLYSTYHIISYYTYQVSRGCGPSGESPAFCQTYLVAGMYKTVGCWLLARVLSNPLFTYSPPHSVTHICTCSSQSFFSPVERLTRLASESRISPSPVQSSPVQSSDSRLPVWLYYNAYARASTSSLVPCGSCRRSL